MSWATTWCQEHGVDVTLPTLSAPSFIGTFRGFHQDALPARDPKMLLDIGAAGPLVGVVVSVPLVALGLSLSGGQADRGAGGTSLGDSILLWLISRSGVRPFPGL